jgi:hypothetical protein
VYCVRLATKLFVTRYAMGLECHVSFPGMHYIVASRHKTITASESEGKSGGGLYLLG